jgi:hypothetical protein
MYHKPNGIVLLTEPLIPKMMFVLYMLKLRVQVVLTGVVNKILNVIMLKIIREINAMLIQTKRIFKILLKMDVSTFIIPKCVLVVSSKVNLNLLNLNNLNNHIQNLLNLKNQKLK